METANIYNYVLLDAARMGNAMDTAKEMNAGYICLYDGTDSIQLEDVAPYIFSMASQTAFNTWLHNGGWGQSWGIYFSSNTDINTLHNHWQQHLTIYDEAGKESYLRFYDPRVLRIFLPICTSEQLEEFFGPVKYFVVEGETKEEAIVFKYSNGELIEEKIPASKVFGELEEVKTSQSKVSDGATRDKTTEITQPEVFQEGKKPS